MIKKRFVAHVVVKCFGSMLIVEGELSKRYKLLNISATQHPFTILTTLDVFLHITRKRKMSFISKQYPKKSFPIQEI